MSHQIPHAQPLVEVRRGSITESRHRGHIAAVDNEAHLIASTGSPVTVTYLRSSAKPFQALPMITMGAADHFGFNEQELALACASHSGEPIHTEIVASMLNKIGLEPGDLKCGTHEPFNPTVAAEMRAKGEQPSVLQNNCSGKHAAMLALARHLGAPIDTYNLPSNPVQRAIARMISLFSGVPEEDMAVGTDGCGVPVFGVTVKSMALGYARLVSPSKDFDSITHESCSRVVQAMTRHPELIGGTSDRLDTEIMRATPGQLISKVGAEGVYTAGIIPCEKWPNGFGLALKIEDGDDHRARPTVVIEALRQLDVLKDDSLEHVARYAFFPVMNRNGDVVGEIRASFSLSFPEKNI